MKSTRWQSVPSNQATCRVTNHSKVNVVSAHQSQIRKCGHPTLTIVFLCYASHLLCHRIDKFWYWKPAPIDAPRSFSIYRWWPSCRFQFVGVFSTVDKCRPCGKVHCSFHAPFLTAVHSYMSNNSTESTSQLRQLTALLASAAKRAVYRAISRCSSSSDGMLSSVSCRCCLDGLLLI